MAKFQGIIGYIETQETSPGVYQPVITERPYKGDVIRNIQKWEEVEQRNANFTINNRFTIVADAYAYENFPNIRYIQWMGTKWAVNSIEVQRPRLILTVRGVYNE